MTYKIVYKYFLNLIYHIISKAREFKNYQCKSYQCKSYQCKNINFFNKKRSYSPNRYKNLNTLLIICMTKTSIEYTVWMADLPTG